MAVTLLIPLVLTTLCVRALAGWRLSRGDTRLSPWASWPGALGVGLAALLVSSGVTHFVEPQRSGFEAIIPAWVPAPAIMVAVSGVVEFLLALLLVVPRTRRAAAVATALFFVAIVPANVVAAGGVDHPDAPSMPLLPRALLQVVFIAAAVGAALAPRGRPDAASNG